MRYGTLSWRILRHLQAAGRPLFRRADLARLGGYDQVGRALRRLEQAYHVERVGGGLWRLLPHRQPEMEVNRTWSRPSGVPDGVLIAAVLANPTVGDLARLAHAFGHRRLRATLREMTETGEIRPELAAISRDMLANVAVGAGRVYRRLAA